MRIDVCNLGKTGIILGMPWLQAHNSEINQKTREIQMIRYLPLCGRNKEKKDKRARKGKRILEEEKIVRWTVDNKEDQGKEEVEIDYRKIKKMVHKRFLKWRKVFRKVELEKNSNKEDLGSHY